MSAIAMMTPIDLRQQMEQRQQALEKAADGLRLCQTGDISLGIGILEGAIREAPGVPGLHAALACAWQLRGVPHKAARSWRRAMRLAPGQGVFERGFAQALLDDNNPLEASVHFRNALRSMPDDPDAQLGLGISLRRAKLYEDAVTAMRHAVRQRPDFAPAMFELGMALADHGIHAEAAEAFRMATLLDPANADAFCNLANARLELGELEAAEQACREAIRLAPERASLHANLAAILNTAMHFEAAEQAARTALALDADCVPGWTNLGNALHDTQHFDAAAEAYRQGISRAPRDAAAHANLGVTLAILGDLENALLAHRRALSLAPQHPEYHANHALTLIRAGYFGEGWAENEWRWKCAGMPPTGFHQPQWNGTRLEGRRIILFDEAGFGDTLQFVRYAPLVAKRGGEVVLRVQDPLVRLFTGMEGIAEVVGRGMPMPEAPLVCPLLSLPHVLHKYDPSLVPAPYLEAPEEDAEHWRAQLDGLAGKRVGLVWSGAPRLALRDAFLANLRRSMDPEFLAPLGSVNGVAFVSLQKDPVAKPPFAMVDRTAELRDFAATAGMIAALDLVIAVDTGVAHLAAALGKPVWLLSRYDGCWRWGHAGETTPWYATMRIFRQNEPGNWNGVVARVAAELREWRDA